MQNINSVTRSLKRICNRARNRYREHSTPGNGRRAGKPEGGEDGAARDLFPPLSPILSPLESGLETTDAPCGVVEEPLHFVTLWTYQHATQQLDTSNINVLMTLRQASKNVTMSHQHAN
ncbi:hypothetical protein H109_05438 [Trichophyton interdigitale MR816]|uniref:Uncharacterized protein n=1 Tax=Trichophyton interdigitale (strain MR816) TaxID=1215338 RepID=A0A059J4B2_TRIIM|nr:hypothetical protein H109_05438 [Trichophyton interdigitale MR816]